jgi:hypothetical protein
MMPRRKRDARTSSRSPLCDAVRIVASGVASSVTGPAAAGSMQPERPQQKKAAILVKDIGVSAKGRHTILS